MPTISEITTVRNANDAQYPVNERGSGACSPLSTDLRRLGMLGRTDELYTRATNIAA